MTARQRFVREARAAASMILVLQEKENAELRAKMRAIEASYQ
jgi:hypothetical protein